MIVWVDARLPPGIAPWITEVFGVAAKPVREIHLQGAVDSEIFMSAREDDAVIMTKDTDFTYLLERHGPPPQIIWIKCGNTPNSHLREILTAALPNAISLLENGEPVIEISDI